MDHSCAGCFASGCECRLRDNPCCPCGRGEADGDRNNGRALAEGGSDWHSHWSSEECLEPSQSHGPHWHSSLTAPTPTWPSSCPMVPRERGGQHLQRRVRESCKRHWRSCRDGCWHRGQSWRGVLSRYRKVNSTQPQRILAWLQQAPQGRAPSGSGGKRRTPVSWIRLASSLEETKRKGARWVLKRLNFKGVVQGWFFLLPETKILCRDFCWIWNLLLIPVSCLKTQVKFQFLHRSAWFSDTWILRTVLLMSHENQNVSAS